MVSGRLRPVVFCHCEQCRRQSGLYFACTSVDDDRLEVGGESLRWFASSADVRRGFCGNCGSPLFWKHAALTSTSVLAGAFDHPSGLVASHHIFTEAKGDFYEIADSLPRFGGEDGVLVLGSG